LIVLPFLIYYANHHVSSGVLLETSIYWKSINQQAVF